MSNPSLYGKSELSEAHPGIDLSGRDFESIYLSKPLSLSHSFLNGASFTDSIFFDIDIDQTEMAEAYFEKCSFNNVKLSGADLVGSSFVDCAFIGCYFTEGEWRSSKFVNVLFDSCYFDYTTINLCVFENCKFSQIAKGSLSHNSVNYNVFCRTEICERNIKDSVVSQNFGMPTPDHITSIKRSGAQVSLEDVCLTSGRGSFSIPDFVSAIYNEFHHGRRTRLKKLRLEFVSNIISAVSSEKRISSTSLLYIEIMLQSHARTLTNEGDMLSVMKAILGVRSALYDLSNETRENIYDIDHSQAACRKITILYQHTFPRDDAIALTKSIGIVSCGDPNAFYISEFRNGSTFIEMVASTTIQVSSVLFACGLLIRQATVTVERATQLKKAVNEFIQASAHRRKKRAQALPSKAPALQRTGSVSPELDRVKKALQDSGEALVRLDDKADIKIYATESHFEKETED
ncbi:pentapeptide repeat-containing protein [Roseomonas genomospecies 6]|uniref:Pentapeptide repeat-containing protein n=1 Tax=Roseomonas genomospecies 6 TaxID=214106 RepID=A0A9W7NDN9_9PROT|nr:pentapeptide repeat-containing protein [Roseomonas genomospecies 6]KAA0675637.1 hypothetical protein DS843_30695 [Roseomonas genomospecies 6]